MSEVITGELRFLLVSIVWGAGIAACYEFLRLVRLVFRHGQMWTGLEDLLYWTICAILIFIMVMEENDGMVRWYVLAGCAAGACVYQFIFHPVVVFVLTPLKIAVKFSENFLRKLLKKKEKSCKLERNTKEVVTQSKEERHGQLWKEKEKKAKPSGHAGHHTGGSRAHSRPGQ
ncbi:MAG: hypothetical protein HFI38_05020 [Lachnospiraceae bacterium]|nr:hypothetical protein [Lachnospiraceae bacterium]